MGYRLFARARVAELMKSGVRVAIDCSMDGTMSDKVCRDLKARTLNTKVLSVLGIC